VLVSAVAAVGAGEADAEGGMSASELGGIPRLHPGAGGFTSKGVRLSGFTIEHPE